MGKIQVIAITSPTGSVKFSWKNSDWTAGAATDTKTLTVANAGTLAYSVNVKSKLTIEVSNLPLYLNSLTLNIPNTGAGFSNSPRILIAGTTATGLPPRWRAVANLTGPPAPSSVTATFTIIDF